VTKPILTAMLLAAALPPPAARGQEAQGGGGDLGKQLSNPISSLVSVPIQVNWDFGAGERDPRVVMNLQPVMPFPLSRKWNSVARVIAPIVSQPPATEAGTTHFGLGDLTFEGFLTPAKAKGITWGAGPILGVPMGSDPFLGSGKWTAGPAGLLLDQTGHWTLGILATQSWSFAGDGGRENVSAAFFQPFVAFAATKTVTLTATAEASANWRAGGGDRWTVPVHLLASKIVKLGAQPLSLQLGPGWYAAAPDGGPEWRLRAVFVMLFPTPPPER